MVWIVCGSVFVGFLLGVVFMAIFSLSQETDSAAEESGWLTIPPDAVKGKDRAKSNDSLSNV